MGNDLSRTLDTLPDWCGLGSPCCLLADAPVHPVNIVPREHECRRAKTARRLCIGPGGSQCSRREHRYPSIIDDPPALVVQITRGDKVEHVDGPDAEHVEGKS